MRKHIAWYLHGLRGAARMRVEVNAQTEAAAVLALLDRFAAEAEEA